MDQLVELLKQIEELVGVAVDAVEGAAGDAKGGDKPKPEGEGGRPPAPEDKGKPDGDEAGMKGAEPGGKPDDGDEGKRPPFPPK